MRGDLLQELAHAVMEFEKSHNVAFGSRRTRKTGSIIQYKWVQRTVNQGNEWDNSQRGQGPENRGANEVKARVQGPQEAEVPMSKGRRG